MRSSSRCGPLVVRFVTDGDARGGPSEMSTSTATPTERPAETTSSQTTSETVAGEVLGYRVESAPEGATVVPASDEGIDVGGPVWQAIEEVAESGTATIPIEGDGFREARATLRSLPYSDSDDNLGGVYVRTNGTVVRLLLSVDV